MFMNNAAALSMDSAFGFTERREEVISFFFSASSSSSSSSQEREREMSRVVGCKTFGDFQLSCFK